MLITAPLNPKASAIMGSITSSAWSTTADSSDMYYSCTGSIFWSTYPLTPSEKIAARPCIEGRFCFCRATGTDTDGMGVADQAYSTVAARLTVDGTVLHTST